MILRERQANNTHRCQRARDQQQGQTDTTPLTEHAGRGADGNQRARQTVDRHSQPAVQLFEVGMRVRSGGGEQSGAGRSCCPS